jgi:hypothetical protein
MKREAERAGAAAVERMLRKQQTALAQLTLAR